MKGRVPGIWKERGRKEGRYAAGGFSLAVTDKDRLIVQYNCSVQYTALLLVNANKGDNCHANYFLIFCYYYFSLGL